MIKNLNDFCPDKLWDEDILWNTDIPKLTTCFRQFILIIVPNLIYFIFIPFEINYIIQSKSKKIRFNFYNSSRLFLCALIILFNSFEFVHLIYLSNKNQSVVYLIDWFSCIIKLLTSLILFTVFIYHRLYGIITSGFIWTFLLLNNICYIILILDIYYFKNSSNYSTFDYYLIQSYFCCIFILFLQSFFTDNFIEADLKISKSIKSKNKNNEENKDNIELKRKISPEINASFFSKITYSWFTPLIVFGSKNLLTDDSFYILSESKSINYILEKFNENFKSKKQHLKLSNNNFKFSSLNLISVFFKTYGLTFIFTSFLKIIHDILQFFNPLFLNLLILFFNDTNAYKWHGILISLAIFAFSNLKCILINNYFEIIFSIAMKVKSNLIYLIYSKSLKLSSKAKKDRTAGEIVNLMSVDTARIVEIIQILNLIWSAPFQIIFSLFFLYKLLGVAVFSGVFLILFIIFVNAILILYNKRIQIKQMKIKDERIKLMNEMLNGIKVIKLYGWEKAFIENVTQLRLKELNYLKKSYYFSIFSSFLFTFTPVFVSLITFALYICLDKNNILTPEKVFTSFTLFNILQFPINLLPTLINNFITANVSFNRITNFINAEETFDYISREKDDENAITLSNANLVWSTSDNCKNDFKKNNTKLNVNKKSGLKSNNIELNEKDKNEFINEDFKLSNLNCKIKKNSFVAIIGQVGSGKSSLLSALLGEMRLLQNQDNNSKINIASDQTISYVGQQSWIQNDTLRNNILFYSEYDEEKYDIVLESCALKPDIKCLPGGDLVEIGEKGINLSGGQKQRISLARACYSNSNLVLLDDSLSSVDAHVAKHLIESVFDSKTGILKNKTRILVTNQLNILKNVDQVILMKDGKIEMNCTYEHFINEKKENLEKCGIKFDNLDNINNEEMITKNETKKNLENSHLNDQDNIKLIEKEKLEIGHIKLENYLSYFKNANFLGFAILFFILQRIISLYSITFLTEWTNFNFSNLTEIELFNFNKYQLKFYSLIIFSESFVQLFSYIFLSIASISAAIKFHNVLLNKIMRSPINFFNITPLGRILNRFSRDIDVLDMFINNTFSSFLQCLLKVLACIYIIVNHLPNFIFFIIPLIVIYYYIQKIYTSTLRQINRFESITKSPIYSHFSETLSDTSTIKAYRKVDLFLEKLKSKIDLNNICYYPSIIANRWLSTRLELLGNIIVLGACINSVFLKNILNSGIVGLIISYAMNITTYLSWIIRMLSNLESNMISIERINEYCNNEEEDLWEKDFKPPFNWPDKGIIEFENYSTRYRKGMDLVLKDLSFKIDSLEKIGVVGRTGAGKSTITLALFRALEAVKGRILIDGIDISEIGLHDLRSRLSIIPQDPVLFSGTIRFNLDPFDEFTDTQIWRALELVYLKKFVNNFKEGLFYKVNESGQNLSVGQKQLICLARALLRNSKILILDEATASVDYQTDELIQKTIKTEFRDCTTITIAHRINTILDSSKILVLDQGTKQEYQSSEVLINDKNSLFYSLMKSSDILMNNE